MRLSVRKASLSLFLQEQRRQLKENVLSLVENQETLKESMLKLISVEEKLVALDEEIETDKNVDLLNTILRSHKRRKLNLDLANLKRLSLSYHHCLAPQLLS